MAESTQTIRSYEPGVIPGLLQTSAYATARLKRIADFSGVPNDVSAAVVARLARQHRFLAGPRRLIVVLEEAALHNRIGSVEMMAGQLGHLINAASLPNIAVGIIPPDIDRIMWSSPGFWIFDEERVLVETPTAELTITQPGEIEIYGRTFAALSDMAVRGAAARSLITAAIDRLSLQCADES